MNSVFNFYLSSSKILPLQKNTQHIQSNTYPFSIISSFEEIRYIDLLFQGFWIAVFTLGSFLGDLGCDKIDSSF